MFLTSYKDMYVPVPVKRSRESASSLLRLRRRQPSVSGARLAPAPCSTRGPS